MLHWSRMRVVARIHTKPEVCIRRDRKPNRHLAAIGGSMALSLALLCFLVCAWRWSYELSWTSRFLVTGGVLSHWQVWFLAGGLLQALAVKLAHYAEPRPKPASSDAVVHT